MYEILFGQADSLFKPLSHILSLNLKAIDSVREKQIDVLSRIVDQGVGHAKTFSTEPSIESFCSIHQAYWGVVQETLSASVKDTFELWTDTQAKVGDILRASNSGSDITKQERAVAGPLAAAEQAVSKKAVSKPATGRKKPTPKAKPRAPAASKTDVESH